MLHWLLIGCSGPPDAEGAQSGGPPPALVETTQVQDGSLSETWSYLGEVQALGNAQQSVGAAGAVSRVTVWEGDGVSAGDLLVEVDPGLASAALREARARRDQGAEELAQARRDQERMDKVADQVLAASEKERLSSQVRRAEASQEALEAAVRRAEVELERHRVRAPFDGVVTARHVDPGDWVTPGQPVLDVIASSSVEVRVEAPVDLVSRLKAGQDATIAGRDDVAGKVAAVVPALDPVARTALVRITPGEVPDWLLPGSPVEVRFPVTFEGEGVVVPRDALIQGPTDARVVKVIGGNAEPVQVQVIARSDDRLLVAAEGLSAGDVLVTRGNERLRPGQPVNTAAEAK